MAPRRRSATHLRDEFPLTLRFADRRGGDGHGPGVDATGPRRGRRRPGPHPRPLIILMLSSGGGRGARTDEFASGSRPTPDRRGTLRPRRSCGLRQAGSRAAAATMPMHEVPYCGAPPVPGGVTWNLDPILIGLLLALGAFVTLQARAAPVGWARTAGPLGWLVLALALVSPLCNLSVALFTARVGQHLLLILVAAPLLALGGAWPRRWPTAGAAPAAFAFAVALWMWHLPGPYGASFRSDTVYWAMHLTLSGTALWFWAALLRRASERPEVVLLAGLGTAVQMALLGALLTLAPRPLFAVHAGTTGPWGLTWLEDQQLGGLLMWVPGGLLFAGVMLAVAAMVLRRAQAPQASPSAAEFR